MAKRNSPKLNLNIWLTQNVEDQSHFSLEELSSLVEHVGTMDGISGNVQFDPNDRLWNTVFRNENLVVYRIAFNNSQRTTLHDHGGASGAYYVVSGTILEIFYTGNERHVRRPRDGSTVTMSPEHIHSVGSYNGQAVVIHAYANPPLREMRLYEMDGSVLKQVGTWVDPDR